MVCDVATRLAYCQAGRAVYKGRHVGVQCSRQLLSVGLYTSDVTSVRACVLCVLCCTGVAMSTTNPDPYGLRQVSDLTRPTGSVLALMTRDLCTIISPAGCFEAAAEGGLVSFLRFLSDQLTQNLPDRFSPNLQGL